MVYVNNGKNMIIKILIKIYFVILKMSSKVTLIHKQNIEKELLEYVDEINIVKIITDHIFCWKWISEHKDMDFNFLVKNQKKLYWALVLEKNKNLKVNIEERSKLWEISSNNNYRYY